MEDLKKKVFTAIKQGDEKLIRILAAIVEEFEREPEKKHGSETLQEIILKTRRTDSHPIKENEDTLYRLVYTSVRKEQCDESCIKNILSSCIKNNHSLGITGILIHTRDRFLQILEGPYENVSMLYNKIKDDPRHGASNMRFCEAVTERHFSDWHMAFKNLDTDDVNYNTQISPEEKEMYASLVDGNLSSYKDDGMRVLKSFLAVG